VVVSVLAVEAAPALLAASVVVVAAVFLVLV